ncbi:unnamed protein product [Lactuca saligna]|uniref:Uncharacterized protein n=1 Tax=Lactuca saligna TaxID=75948 RepID=A0AA36ENE8_LACSI|nr:unnamed protein product [Lactuca saligna]
MYSKSENLLQVYFFTMTIYRLWFFGTWASLTNKTARPRPRNGESLQQKPLLSKVKKKTNIIEMQKKEMEEVRVNAATAIFLCFLILTSSQRLCSDMVQNPNVNYNVVTLSTVLLACATISTLILAMHFHGWVCRKRSIYIRNNNTNIEQKW